MVDKHSRGVARGQQRANLIVGLAQHIIPRTRTRPRQRLRGCRGYPPAADDAAAKVELPREGTGADKYVRVVSRRNARLLHGHISLIRRIVDIVCFQQYRRRVDIAHFDSERDIGRRRRGVVGVGYQFAHFRQSRQFGSRRGNKT